MEERNGVFFSHLTLLHAPCGENLTDTLGYGFKIETKEDLKRLTGVQKSETAYKHIRRSRRAKRLISLRLQHTKLTIKLVKLRVNVSCCRRVTDMLKTQ